MNNLEHQDIYLDVNHVWQEDPEHNIPPEEARKVCAIAAMKIVMDYLPPEGDRSIQLAEIREWMIAHHGLNEVSNWLHAAQVDYFKKLGYTAWRRNWQAPTQDPTWFVNHEHYDVHQLKAVTDQGVAEHLFETTIEKVTHSFVQSFKNNCPVIASVKLGFDEHGANHQIVLNGFKSDESHSYFYYTDPIDNPAMHTDRQLMTTERFFQYFNYLAIFAKPNLTTH